MDSNNETNEVNETTLAELKNEVYELKDLFYRRLMNDKQKTELINTVSGLAQFAVIEPFLDDIFLLIDRIERVEDEFSVSVCDELYEILNRRGVEKVDTAGTFNPEHHRVIRTEEMTADTGTIVEVVRNGYIFNGKVIRFADVVVAK
jgi:molecular chaperone GrpE (heat shock protein)